MSCFKTPMNIFKAKNNFFLVKILQNFTNTNYIYQI